MSHQHSTPDPSTDDNTVKRRKVLLAGGAMVAGSALTACVVPPTQPTAAPATGENSAPTPSPGERASSDAAEEKSEELAKLDDVPLGGGVVLSEKQVVVTRDNGGKAHAFSSICTHQGCSVASVSGGTINCPCHNSKFDATNGAPVAGPATRPLPSIAVKQTDTAVYRA
ncbi:Rieske (2Fe-2S) protein [Streptomyces cinereoruber]|uniref:Rieske (2Fe-2S) protein n=1 Tax=Streptomyces cinereoruber TaxID=67260 RepID=UPI003639465A